MNPVSDLLLGCGLGALLAACISAPFLAPWSIRVRYLAAAPMVDPWFGLAPAPLLEMRVVTLTSVESDHGRVVLVVDGLGTGRARRSTRLNLGSCAPFIVARFDGWAALHTPLLVVIEEDRRVSLYGPHGAIAELVVAEQRRGNAR